MSSTSIGRGPAHGGNENHDGDPSHTTMGEAVHQEPPAGSGLPDEPQEPAMGKQAPLPPRPQDGGTPGPAG